MKILAAALLSFAFLGAGFVIPSSARAAVMQPSMELVNYEQNLRIAMYMMKQPPGTYGLFNTSPSESKADAAARLSDWTSTRQEILSSLAAMGSILGPNFFLSNVAAEVPANTTAITFLQIFVEHPVPPGTPELKTLQTTRGYAQSEYLAILKLNNPKATSTGSGTQSGGGARF
jgi:hypothetical protein